MSEIQPQPQGAQPAEKPQRFQPRVAQITVNGVSEKVYQVSPTVIQRKSDVQKRITRLDQVIADAEAARDNPDTEALLAQHRKAQDRRIEMAGKVKTALGEVLTELEA